MANIMLLFYRNACIKIACAHEIGLLLLYHSQGLIADSGQALSVGAPIIQYNTQTNQRKAIAFLSSFYAKARGYATNKIYGEALSPDSLSLFVVSNGNKVNGPCYPAVYTIHIPASER